MTRRQILFELAARIAGNRLNHPIRVAIDGIDASGKTSLADELQTVLVKGNRPIIRASLDAFHNPEAVRYSQGRTSPRGYFEDSFNYNALIEKLLNPLGPGGNRIYYASYFDYQLDRMRLSTALTAHDNSILLFDGIFLQRPELQDKWDLSIFLSVPFEVSLSRALQRDLEPSISADSIQELYKARYIPAQQIYLDSCQPESKADILIRNYPLDHPIIESVRQ